MRGFYPGLSKWATCILAKDAEGVLTEMSTKDNVRQAGGMLTPTAPPGPPGTARGRKVAPQEPRSSTTPRHPGFSLLKLITDFWPP